MITGATLAACGGGGDGSSQADATPPSASAPATGDGKNRAPTISGTPAMSATAGQSYTFQPSASDPENDKLTFTISNKPDWATFDPSTGKLSGTPKAEHVGTYKAIEIAATDGTSVTALPAFNLLVSASGSSGGTRAVTLAWEPPAQNSDGSALTDLSGYKIHYGTTTQNYSQTITVDNPGLTEYVVPNLSAGTYYFAVTAFNSKGGESPFSSEVVTTLN